MAPPEDMRWLFWEVDFDSLDVNGDTDYILARLLEHGRLVDVRWAIRTYGLDRIHRFFREVGHPELSPSTLSFWRALFEAKDEVWKQPPAWRRNSAVPWPP